MKHNKKLGETQLRKSEPIRKKSQRQYISGKPRGRTVADCQIMSGTRRDALIAWPLQGSTYKYFLGVSPI